MHSNEVVADIGDEIFSSTALQLPGYENTQPSQPERVCSLADTSRQLRWDGNEREVMNRRKFDI